MLIAIIAIIVIVAAYGFARWTARREGGQIPRRPYNNRYSDASGSRDDSFS
jgi:FtsZ-interacting cell division protein ZipA